MTYRDTADSVVNLVYRIIQKVELSISLVTFLEFTLEMTEDAVVGKAALARQAHAATSVPADDGILVFGEQ